MITIRPATVDDLPTVEALARITWPVTYGHIVSASQLEYMLDLIYNNASLRDQLLNKQHSFLIAESAGEPVGFASFSVEKETAVVAKLHKIYIRPNTQGMGIGKQLIDHIVANLQAQAVPALHLNVNRYNNARGFYEKLGFTVIREEDIDIGGGYFMNDYVMEKKLILQ